MSEREDTTLYIERSKVREIVIGHNVATQAVLSKIDALQIFTVGDFRIPAQRATPEQMGRAYYLARYEKDGAKWEANDHKMLWVRMAQRYHEILASSDTSTDGGLPETLRRNDREHL